VDLRWIGHGRPTLKDPSHPAWPEGGRRTEDEREAVRWAAVYVERFTGSVPVRRLGAMVESYKTHRARLVEPRTFAGDSTALAHLLDHYPATYPVANVELQGLANALLDEGYRVSTVRQYATSLKGLWRWLELPFPDVRTPKPAKPDVRYWTDGQVATLRAKAPKVDPQLLIALDCTLYMGLRVGEVFGLRWTDITGDTVRVQRQIPQGRTTPKPLKGKKARTALVLPGWTHSGVDGYVVHRDGAPIGRRVQWRWMRELLDAAGLNRKGAGYHTGRHTYARMCLEAGMSLEQLRMFLGHSSVRTTEDTYGHMREAPTLTLARRALNG
jgi:integrase